MSKVIEPLKLDVKKFKQRFKERARYRWAKPSVWLISHEPTALYRELEVLVILSLFEQSKNIFKWRHDLWSDADRLEEVRTLADFATEQGVSIIGLLMRTMLYSDEHCRRLLILSGWKADVAKNPLTMVLDNRDGERFFNRKKVDRSLSVTMRPCPGKLVNKSTCAGVVAANHDLCWHCHQIYGFTREEYPKWMLFMVQDDRREYYARAKEAIYFEELPDEKAA